MAEIITWGVSLSEQQDLQQRLTLAELRFINLQEDDLSKRLEELVYGRKRSLEELRCDSTLQALLQRVPKSEKSRIETMMTQASPISSLLPKLSGWTYLLLLLPQSQLTEVISAAKSLLPGRSLIFSAVTPLALSWFTGDYLEELQQEHLLMQEWRRKQLASSASSGPAPSP